jgi:DnaJ family protein A protein 2
MSLYDDLGLERAATPTEIKNAYRKLAMKHHPDKGGDPETFKKISHAYEVLNDQSKRKMYDMTGSEDAPTGMGNPFGGFEGMFNMFKPTDTTFQLNHTTSLRVSLEECYKGCKKRFSIEVERTCDKCKAVCKLCNGMGIKHIQMGPLSLSQNCPKQVNTGCSECSFKNTLHIPKTIDVVIEKGSKEGDRIVVRGMGIQRADDIGDLIFVIQVKPHEYFRREGDALIYKHKLLFIDSVNGTIITIPHFDGPMTLSTQDFGIIDPRKRYLYRNFFIEFDVQYPPLESRFILTAM